MSSKVSKALVVELNHVLLNNRLYTAYGTVDAVSRLGIKHSLREEATPTLVKRAIRCGRSTQFE